MQLGLPTSPELASDAGKRKRGRTAEAASEEEGRILVLLAKLSLSSAQASRITKGVFMQVFQAPADNSYVQAMMQAGKTFADTAEKMGREERDSKLGLPHIHVFNAMLQVTMERFANKPEKKDRLLVLQNFARIYGEMGIKVMMDEIRYARVSKMFSKEVKKIEVNVMPPKFDTNLVMRSASAETPTAEMAWAIIAQELEGMGGVKRLPGVAPPGDLERRVQSWLERQSA